MVMDLQQEALAELEGAGELLHQLPHTLHKLCEHWGHLFGVPIQVATPREVQKAEYIFCHPPQNVPLPSVFFQVRFMP